MNWKKVNFLACESLRKAVISTLLHVVILLSILIPISSKVPVKGEPLTSFTVNVFDESGFPPPSLNGRKSLQDITVSIYTLNDVPMAVPRTTNSTGSATFDLPNGTYKIVCNSSAYSGNKTVDVSGVSNYTDVYCFDLACHSHEPGVPLELNYIDLNTSQPGYQNTIYVDRGEVVHAEFSWWEIDTGDLPVWWVSVFGNWTNSTLGNLEQGLTTSNKSHTKTLDFQAPAANGTYEIRLNSVLDFDWPVSYYTGMHYQQSLGRDSRVRVISNSTDDTHAYGIGTIVVGPRPASPTFVLEVQDALQMKLNEIKPIPVKVGSKNGFDSTVNLSVVCPENLDAYLQNSSLYIPENQTIGTKLVIQSFWNTTLDQPITIQLWGNSDSISMWKNINVTIAGEAPPPIWSQGWLWAIIGMAGIVVASYIGLRFYKKWRRARTPADTEYLAAAAALAKLDELRQAGKISDQEYGKKKKEYERVLRGG